MFQFYIPQDPSSYLVEKRLMLPSFLLLLYPVYELHCGVWAFKVKNLSLISAAAAGSSQTFLNFSAFTFQLHSSRYVALFPHDICPTKAFVDWLSIRKLTRVLVLSLFSLLCTSSKFLAPCPVLKRPTGGLVPAGGPISPPTFPGLGLMLRTCTELFQVTLLLLALIALLCPSSSSSIQWK